MPEISGYEATEAIRRRDQANRRTNQTRGVGRALERWVRSDVVAKADRRESHPHKCDVTHTMPRAMKRV